MDSSDESILTREELKANLSNIGIQDFSQDDFEKLCRLISSEKGTMTNVHRYVGGHLF